MEEGEDEEALHYNRLRTLSHTNGTHLAYLQNDPLLFYAANEWLIASSNYFNTQQTARRKKCIQRMYIEAFLNSFATSFHILSRTHQEIQLEASDASLSTTLHYASISILLIFGLPTGFQDGVIRECELDEVVDGVPRNERSVIGAVFNGHVGEGNKDDEEVMGRYGFKERNVEGQMVVDFAKRIEMAEVNTYIKKKDEHRVTYKSGGRCTQVDYDLCGRCNLKEIGDCKVLTRDSVARQHRMVVCKMVLEVKKKKRRRVRTERRIKWWKLRKGCSVRFRFRATTAGVMRETARKVFGVTF
ncbi:hypothetical protein C0J50_8947 [Silurus asotus]|uniref:Uncharacterized protein n=1 Tax=Silurus asotus TaxID=30991 RepID=A0AAD5FGD4_SILAS|nr:hypothetical protein C0J50_8947 [Silurus asotus]